MADARSADAVCAVAVRVTRVGGLSVSPRAPRARRAARPRAGGPRARRARRLSMSGSKIRDPFPQTHTDSQQNERRSLARQTAPPSASKTPSRARRRNDRQSMWRMCMALPALGLAAFRCACGFCADFSAAQSINGCETPARAAEAGGSAGAAGAGGSAGAAGAGGSETPPLMKQKIGWTLPSPVRSLYSL